MLKWFRRYLAWLCIAIAVAGAALATLGWLRQAHVAQVMRDGREAVAVIERAHSFARKDVSTFEINLAWSDAAGKVRRAKQVPITANFANRIIADGVLLVPATKIRFVVDDRTRLPVVVEDAGAQTAAARRLQFLGLLGLALGIIGAVLFARRWRRKVAP